MIQKLSAVILFLVCIIPYTVYANNTQFYEISAEKLPDIVIAYSLFCSRYNEFKKLDTEENNVLIKLGKSFDQLEVGASTRLAFSKRSFIVQNIEGYFSGILRIKDKTIEESNIPFESVLFVTTPIASFNNQILVIISSVSPERTTILSIDDKLDAKLLYDTFNKYDSIEISSIYFIKALGAGTFVLESRIKPQYRDFYKGKKNRYFLLKVNQKFEIKEIQGNKAR